MKVIKRDGRIQNFDIEKIKISIERASDEAETPFTASDIEHTAKDIKEELLKMNTDKVHVEEIQRVVVNSLIKNGFPIVAKLYDEYSK